MKKIAFVTWIVCVFAFSLNFHLGMTAAWAGEGGPNPPPCDEWYVQYYDYCPKQCYDGQWSCCTLPNGTTGWRHLLDPDCDKFGNWVCECYPPIAIPCNPCNCPLYCGEEQ
jgi:hypothetical protein